MPYKCSVPGCRGNYDSNGPTVSCFSFPKEQDEQEKWRRAIHREDFEVTKNSRVCELHFKSDDFVLETSVTDEHTGVTLSAKLSKPKIAKGAVPSLLPNLPSYLSSYTSKRRPSKEEKAKAAENLQLRQALEESQRMQHEEVLADHCQSLADVRKKLKIDLPWNVLDYQNYSVLCVLSSDNEKSVLASSLHITEGMQMVAYLFGVAVPSLGDLNFPCSVSSIKAVYHAMEVLADIATVQYSDQMPASHTILILQLVLQLLLTVRDTASSSLAGVLWFVCEQISLGINRHQSYSPDLLVFCSLFYNISPQAYRFLRESGKLVLPAYTTVRRINASICHSPVMEQSNPHFLNYISQKFKSLSPSDHHVLLLIDEIHLKPFFDYVGGTIVGGACTSQAAATTACTFMISSIFSKFKDVVHVMPCFNLESSLLYEMILRIVVGLEAIGFRVIGAVTDNNSVNRKAISQFSSPPVLSPEYIHPCDASRPFFYIFDAVHIFKCVRNNWLNLKNVGRSMMYPPFFFDDICSEIVADGQVRVAPFESLIKLHSIECDKLVKFSYSLSMKALNPSRLERQKVSLVTKIFNPYVSQALLSLGCKHQIPHFHDCSVFIKVITRWWQVVNVKSPLKGQRLSNIYEQPMTSSKHSTYRFLVYFFEWLERWCSLESNGFLTNETYTALRHTTIGFLKISEFCFEKPNASYVLLGKFQTDSLEARFGQYRQLAGGQYHVSLRQIYECEKKLRLLSTLQLKVSGRHVTISDCAECTELEKYADSAPLDIEAINDDDLAQCQESLPVLFYLAGYCVYAACKKLKC